MPDGSYWKPIWRHECDFGHDKGQSIAEHRDSASVDSTIPLIVFIGDGISDLPAARHADILFARKGLYLEKYCLENKIAFIPFETFADIQTEIAEIVKDDQENTGGFGLPALFNPRAHSWRLFSNKTAVRSRSYRPIWACAEISPRCPCTILLLIRRSRCSGWKNSPSITRRMCLRLPHKPNLKNNRVFSSIEDCTLPEGA